MSPDRGQVGTWRSRVEEPDTAHALGNPDIHVLATPVLAEFCDRAAKDACERAGAGPTRRMRVDIRHLAATPVGDTVEVYARLAETCGDRLVFEIEGEDSRRTIVSGQVIRILDP